MRMLLKGLFMSALFFVVLGLDKPLYAQVFNYPAISNVGCYDGSNYTLNISNTIVGIRINSIYNDNGSTGSFGFDVIFRYNNTFTGVIGNGAPNFYNYQVTFYSRNRNAVTDKQASLNVTPPMSSTASGNLFTTNNNAYSGSALALGLTANTVYTDLTTINLFGFDSSSINVGAPCVSTSRNAIGVNTSLSAIFGTVTASIENNELQVDWSTTKEQDNNHFNIQVSADGQEFTTIASVASKATNGNSSELLQYHFVQDMSDVTKGFAVLGLISLSLGAFAKTRRWMLLTILTVSIFIVACSKNNDAVADNKNSKVFVRVAQVDKDGAVTYSKVVTAKL